MWPLAAFPLRCPRDSNVAQLHISLPDADHHVCRDLVKVNLVHQDFVCCSFSRFSNSAAVHATCTFASQQAAPLGFSPIFLNNSVKMKDFLVVLLLGACQLVLGQNITDVPLCAVRSSPKEVPRRVLIANRQVVWPMPPPLKPNALESM